MLTLLRRCTPFFLLLFTVMFLEAGITTDYADARAKFGGRSFKRSAPKKSTGQQYNKQQNTQKSGFGRGLAGGLLGGAIGGMLFGSLFGMGGSGMGILPLLLLGVVGYFLYKRFVNRPSGPSSAGYQPPPFGGSTISGTTSSGSTASVPPVPPIREADSLETGLAEIRLTDPGFEENHFIEVASDVFFKVQAGWMRRDLATFGHLLGEQLADGYRRQFDEMLEKGQINKLESIAIRKVEIVDAGSDTQEDFVTVLFTANLLDYTVDEQSGDVIEGSMTNPVKFAEKWSWSRPVRTENWKLEGIEVVEG